MIAPTKQYEIPAETLAVFNSTMIARKKRISLLVEWFMENWHHWFKFDVEPGQTFSTSSSITHFAEGLSRALAEYEIVINRQRVWTWLVQRNLPRSDNFYVMAKHATGWQREFARLVLDILASSEPDLPQS